MAFVYEESFLPSSEITNGQPYLAADMNELLRNVNSALKKISGPPVVTPEGPLYQRVPKGLKTVHGLKSNFENIWGDTIISYDPKAYGASADFGETEIIFGEFFTKPQSILILEKVLMHEFLHLVVDLPRPMHHGRIDHIIKYGLKLPGDPNPLGTVGYECGQ
jgi:hypothetical protein